MKAKTRKATTRPAAAAIAAAIILLFGAACLAQVNDAGIVNNQGVELYERGNPQGAIKMFQRALEVDPMNPTIHANMGYAYQAMNDHQSAILEFKKALNLNPNDLEIHNNLGISLYNLGQREQAVAEWQFILASDPMNAAAAGNMAMIQHPEIADEIILETRDALMSPVEKEVLVSRGLTGLFDTAKTYFKQERYQDAANILLRIVEAKPSSRMANYYLGMSYSYMLRSIPAMRHLREYLILESYPPECRECYTEAKRVFKLMKMGQSIEPKAKATTSRVAAVFDQGKDAYRVGDYFKAINLLTQVYNYKPTSYPTNYYLGMAYREVGDRERAVFHLSKCLLAGNEDRTREKAVEIAHIIKSLTQ